MASGKSQDLWVAAGDGTRFVVHVAGWPEETPLQDAPDVFGSYWPPQGVDVIDVGEGAEAEREFSVDLNFEASLIRFESDFGLYVSEKLPGQVAVHAALIRIDNAVLVVPGFSGVGKSSLCVAAMDAGFEVWSDEYCLIDTSSGDVTGWTRPIRQRLPQGGVRRINHQGPAGPGRATHVVTMRFDTDTAGLDLEEVSPGQVAMDLMANTVCAQSRSEETFRATTRLAREVKGFGGTRGEIETALPLIRSLLHS